MLNLICMIIVITAVYIIVLTLISISCQKFLYTLHQLMKYGTGIWLECNWTCRLNTLRPWQKGRHFPDDTFKCIFMNENVGISINISLKFVPKGLINNIPALVQIMAWHRPGDKPLSEPMVVRLPTHICVTRPQWVVYLNPGHRY